MLAQFAGRFADAALSTKVGRALNPLPFSPLQLFNREQGHKLMEMSGKDIGKNFSGYFRGQNMKHTNSGLAFMPGDGDARRQTTRRLAAGLTGGLLGANALGINPMGATSAATSLAWLGAHGAIGTTLMNTGYAHSKIAGLGYLGATAVNTFRGGDNMGPM
jgi:hypothetical protein